MEWIYGINWRDVISGVIIIVAGYFIVKWIAQDAIKEWVRENVSPGVGGQRSIVSPRVWTFTLSLSDKFLEELSRQTTTSVESDPDIAKMDSSPELLSKCVIEEYATRMRVHRWLLSAPEMESAHPRYEWFDVAHHPHSTIEGTFEKIFKALRGEGENLWCYSTNQMTCALRLTGTWGADAPTQRIYYRLALYIDRGLFEEEETAPSDVIFQIPLDPGLLDDQRGDQVYVRGEKRKASEVLPYPRDEGDWEDKSGEGDDWRWSWHLGMQTFDKGSMF